jgi:hypothetical protein
MLHELLPAAAVVAEFARAADVLAEAADRSLEQS